VSQRAAEDLVRLLVEYVDCGEVWNDTILRLEHAVGRTYEQIRLAQQTATEPAQAKERDA
jgi:hypothetical protein